MKVEFFGSSSGGGGGTDTNLGNANLSADATTRSYTMASGGNLEIKNNSGNNIVDFTSSNLEIGNTNKYTMPNARGTANQILGQTNGTGTIAFRTMANNITAQAQTCAGQGRGTNTYPSRNVFVPNGMGGLTNLGSSASVTSITGTQIASLCPPFRQNSGTQYGFADGTDRVIVKLEANFGDTFSILLVVADMNTGTTASSTPVTFQSLGTIVVNRAGQWFCEVFNPQDAGLDGLETCAVAWIGFSPNTGSEESATCHILTNYLNSSLITQSYI